MKKTILFVVMLSVMGCQAPKDRSGDAPPAAKPNATDPKVKTQVEPRVIVLAREELKIKAIRDTDQINKLEKDNLAEQSIEKTFAFENTTTEGIALKIEADAILQKSECVNEMVPVVKTLLVLVKNESGTRTVEVDSQPENNLLVPASTLLELTLTVTNPGQCKNLSYSFVVSRSRN